MVQTTQAGADRASRRLRASELKTFTDGSQVGPFMSSLDNLISLSVCWPLEMFCVQPEGENRAFVRHKFRLSLKISCLNKNYCFSACNTLNLPFRAQVFSVIPGK